MKRLLLLFLFLCMGTAVANSTDVTPVKKNFISLRVTSQSHHILTNQHHDLELFALDEQQPNNNHHNNGALLFADYNISTPFYTAQTDFNSLFIVSRGWQRSVAKRAPPVFAKRLAYSCDRPVCVMP